MTTALDTHFKGIHLGKIPYSQLSSNLSTLQPILFIYFIYAHNLRACSVSTRLILILNAYGLNARLKETSMQGLGTQETAFILYKSALQKPMGHNADFVPPVLSCQCILS